MRNDKRDSGNESVRMATQMSIDEIVGSYDEMSLGSIPCSRDRPAAMMLLTGLDFEVDHLKPWCQGLLGTPR